MFKWLSLLAGVLYIVFGTFIIAYRYLLIIESNAAYPFGGLLLIYGIFRLVRVVISLKNGN